MPSKIVDNIEAVEAVVIGATPPQMNTRIRFSPTAGSRSLISLEDLCADFLKSSPIDEKSFISRQRLPGRAPRQKALALLFARPGETKKNQWKHDFCSVSAGAAGIRGMTGKQMNLSLMKRGRRNEGSA